MTPQQFIKKWKPVALTERAAAQSHFIDLCALVGHDDPIKSDPKGEFFTFEKGVTKTGGGDGFADVWKRGFFAWEYKKKKRNLDDALAQLVRYAAALENPPLQVACDTDRFLIRTAWTNAVPKTYEFSLDDLADPKNLDILHSVFFDPEKLRPKETRAGVTREAADKFSTIALRLQGRGTPQEIAHFINQLVFCFFAHSVKLLPDGFFPRLLKRASEVPENANHYLDSLFAAMEKGGDFDLTHVAHFNGGLFDGRRALRLDSGDVGLLIAAGSLDWSQIDPSIFGTLFERFLDPEKRGQIGAHYTDAEKIMMIIEPVILRPLREEWAAVREKIVPIAEKAAGIKPKSQSPGDRRDADTASRRLRAQAIKLRDEFLQRLRTTSILDPACGSGNFLYLALQGVKDIENRAVLECEAMGLPPRDLGVGPEILHGIEINTLAAELARTTIWIGDIQWGIRNAIYARPEPILRPLEAIEYRDALLTKQPNGNFVEADWPEAEFIVGNPPFLGVKKMRRGLGDEYTNILRDVYRGRVDEFSDLVCWWFEKARAQIIAGKAKRAGLVATNSIRGGQNRVVLDKITHELRVFEAWSDEPWVVDGAAVRVSIVCFSSPSEQTPLRLDGLPVARINADLTASMADMVRARKLTENRDVAFIGVQKTGPFDVASEVARAWLKEPLNANNRPNSDVLRPYLNGSDITRRSKDMWIIDFGADLNEREAALYEAPFQYAKEIVKPIRAKNKEESARELWWRHWRPRPEWTEASSKLPRVIVTPRVAKYRLFVWSHPRVLPDSATVAIARDDDTSFGILHSRFHETWSLRLGTSLEDRPRYTPTTTFETFPFPEDLMPNIPARDYANDPYAVAIAKVAKQLHELRNNWLNPPDFVRIEPEVVPGYADRILPKNAQAAAVLRSRTLTNLYNERPQWLVDAHRDLDAAVATAYGWPTDISEEDALGKLLELNLGRAAARKVPTLIEDDDEDE